MIIGNVYEEQPSAVSASRVNGQVNVACKQEMPRPFSLSSHHEKLQAVTSILIIDQQ